MSHPVQYGVFKLGQIWRVVSEDRTQFGYTTRVEALEAARAIARAHNTCGVACEVIVQDEVGRLTPLGPEAPRRAQPSHALSR
jgi:hypothetical protein